MEKKKSLREKYPLAFRPPTPPTSSRWQDMTDDEIMAMEIPGVDPNAPPISHMDQIDIQICEKLREIDNNMAAVHSVLAYEILPVLKDYARVTEPVREVSRFWIAMFEAACAPKQQPEEVVPEEPSTSHTHESSAARTPTASSSSRTDDQEQTPTASDGASFQAFEIDGGGPITSTPVAPPPRKAPGNIFKKAEVSISTATESPHEQLRRDIANLVLDGSSLDLSDPSTTNIPTSAANISISSMSSTQSTKESSGGVGQKGKGRAPQPDLRTKALQNVALGNIQKGKGSIFTERPSASYTSFASDTSIKEEAKPKPTSIFSTNPTAPRNALPVFARMQQQIFAPVAPTGTAGSVQQRMLGQLLKEAEAEKRAGIPAGSPSPARSPARLNTIRQMMSTAHSVSISTDNDTDYSTRPIDQTDVYGNEVMGVRNYELDDYFDDSDEEFDEEEIVDQSAGGHAPAQSYEMEENQSFDSTGWQPRDNVDTAGNNTDTLFGLGNRRPADRDFELQDGFRGEPASFAMETPIRTRR